MVSVVVLVCFLESLFFVVLGKILVGVKVRAHLCFKQAQPKMCHSPKVNDRIDFFSKLLEHLFSDHLKKKNFKLTSYLNR